MSNKQLVVVVEESFLLFLNVWFNFIFCSIPSKIPKFNWLNLSIHLKRFSNFIRRSVGIQRVSKTWSISIPNSIQSPILRAFK